MDRGPDGPRVVLVPTGGGEETVVVADPAPIGRGGVIAWLSGGQRLAYLTADGVAVVGVEGDAAGALSARTGQWDGFLPSEGSGGARVVAEGIEGGAGGLAVSPDGDHLAFVADSRAVTVVPSAGGPALVVSEAADFAFDPCWSPDGERLAWHEWDVPAMPWDESRIVVAAVGAAGAVGGGARRVVVAGGDEVSVQEPRFSPDGTGLAFVSDATGWRNLWIAPVGPDGPGPPRPLVREECEHAGPAWGPGARSFVWSPDSRSIAFCRNEAGFGRLCVVDVATGQVRELSRGIHTSLSWAGLHIACLRSGARTPTSVVVVGPEGGDVLVLATEPGPALAAAAKGFAEPEVVSWHADDGAVVHGRLWRPPTARAGTPPPLLVWAHGGPTDQRRVSFDSRLAFFASRGWAVLHPDCRGSTGWGRAWAQALQGRWGEVDVEDIASGARAAVARGWGDASRLVAMGASAGGMAALLLAGRHPELWAAAVALYPVVDLEGLAAATHRFEAHYPTGLVGPLPDQAERYRSRSPLAVADRISVPVLLLHGSADAVVPAAQSRTMASRLGDRGVVVEHHEYEGEGHGWRSAITVEDELRRTESFLDRHVLHEGDRMSR